MAIKLLAPAPAAPDDVTPKSYVDAQRGQPLALTGATAATRYVGGTTSGAPTSGTFAAGDFVIAQNGTVWICATPGTPGGWLAAGFVNPLTSGGDLLVGADGGALGTVNRATVARLGAGAFSQSGYSFSNTGSLAFDGDDTTYWYLQSGGIGAWIAVDLGVAEYIAGFRVLNFATGANGSWTAYKIQYSVDNVTWVDAYNRTTNAGGDTGKLQLTTPATARFWRFIGTGAPAGGNAGLLTLELYGGATSVSPPTRLPMGAALQGLRVNAAGDGLEYATLAQQGLPLALTGATAASRYAGGTASGAPTTGTFAKGDFVVAQDGAEWVCTTAGTPGTWAQVGSALLGTPQDLTTLNSTLAANVTLTAATWVLVASVTLTPGTWLVFGQMVAISGSVSNVDAQLGDGTTIYASATVSIAATGTYGELALASEPIVVAASTTKTLGLYGNTSLGAAATARAAGGAAASTKATGLRAVKISGINVGPAGPTGPQGPAGGQAGLPLGLVGAQAATRYVGGTTSGPPATGTFAVGDYAVAQDGTLWVCTAAGTPGTWVADDYDYKIGYPNGDVLFFTTSGRTRTFNLRQVSIVGGPGLMSVADKGSLDTLALDSGWQALSFNTFAAAYGTPYGTPQARLLYGKKVELRGMVKIVGAIGNPWAIGSVPVNCRPPVNRIFNWINDTGAATTAKALFDLRIQTDGTIAIQYSANMPVGAWFSLDGLSYWIDA